MQKRSKGDRSHEVSRDYNPIRKYISSNEARQQCSSVTQTSSNKD